jgi:hydrogenase maturation protein HypF
MARASDGWPIWGGEFLLGDASGYERVATLRPFALPGGDAAVHEPRRVALALLYQLDGDSAFGADVTAMRHFGDAERRLLAQMLKRGVNTPVTTSMGRLFDGIASLAGLPQAVTFEGQAAIRLEHIADVSERGVYSFAIAAKTEETPGGAGNRPIVVDWEPVLHRVLEDVRSATPPSTIAARFHNGLSMLLSMLADRRPATSCADWRLL